jgi:hypothetical protein
VCYAGRCCGPRDQHDEKHEDRQRGQRGEHDRSPREPSALIAVEPLGVAPLKKLVATADEYESDEQH